MTDYTELVNALRCKSLSKQCDSCKYGYRLCPDSECNDACNVEQVYADAAAAIEALQAQLPKRGEWIWDDKRCIYVCSVCGSPKVRENMDRQIIKEQAYCYSCGAEMEVQDGENES